MNWKSWISSAAFVAAVTCGPSAPALATTWDVDATFSDGATLTGYFTFDTYGFIGGYNLQTTAGGPFAGFDFTSGGGNISPATSGLGTTSVTFFGPAYNGDQLTLVADQPLATGLSSNVLTGASFECQGSYACPGSGDVRYLIPASISTGAVPEPAGWALMLVGFGMVGYAMRKRPRVHTAVGDA